MTVHTLLQKELQVASFAYRASCRQALEWPHLQRHPLPHLGEVVQGSTECLAEPVTANMYREGAVGLVIIESLLCSRRLAHRQALYVLSLAVQVQQQGYAEPQLWGVLVCSVQVHPMDRCGWKTPSSQGIDVEYERVPVWCGCWLMIMVFMPPLAFPRILLLLRLLLLLLLLPLLLVLLLLLLLLLLLVLFTLLLLLGLSKLLLLPMPVLCACSRIFAPECTTHKK